VSAAATWDCWSATLNGEGRPIVVNRRVEPMRTSRQHIYRLLERYRQDGLDAVDPRSRRPASNPNAVADEVIMATVTLRETLTARGLDAGRARCHCRVAGPVIVTLTAPRCGTRVEAWPISA
jgi:Winged helix-turn helix